jgi:hypothetical protein
VFKGRVLDYFSSDVIVTQYSCRVRCCIPPLLLMKRLEEVFSFSSYIGELNSTSVRCLYQSPNKSFGKHRGYQSIHEGGQYN